jgi:hypothetical protein
LVADPEGGKGLGNTGPTYYDGQRVYFQIADYTGDRSWERYGQAAEVIFRDRNVLPRKGGVPGYWNFTRGLRIDAERTRDEKSREAVLLMARNSAYARDDTPLESTRSEASSREVAYAIMSYIDAEKLGAPRRQRLAALVDQALGHLQQWFVQKSSSNWAPFMVGLTAEALISYHTHIRKDPRIVPALERATDAMWKEAWLPKSEAFFYRADNPRGAAPDLNLLVAPIFAWLYLETGKPIYRDRGDQVFAGGVRHANIDASQKHFNQSYRWSFDYVKWRREADSRWTGKS